MAGKRKREVDSQHHEASKAQTRKVLKASSDVTVQIITGSYERVLHGINATIPHFSTEQLSAPDGSSEPVQFADTFLFNAHTSAIRCLAISPLPSPDQAESQKVILASGSTDERVNLYTLSASPPVTNDQLASIPTLAGSKILENPKNRELGSLMHHSSSISALYFPSRSKLLSAAEDNTIAVSRTRDWTVISTIKAPHPKIQGRPSGDTAPPGGSPQGINDFAVHPSNKLMVSVGKGEKCMRLWNLVTGKKAGVLNFGKEILQSVKESKWAQAREERLNGVLMGRNSPCPFERGVVLFGIDSKPRGRILPSPLTKVHQIKYLDLSDLDEGNDSSLLAVSTEDGRIIFYSTQDLVEEVSKDDSSTSSIPLAQARGQFGGKDAGTPGRIKDFEILDLRAHKSNYDYVIITAGSDGAVRLWGLKSQDLQSGKLAKKSKKQTQSGKVQPTSETGTVGKLLGTYQSGNRITCLKAFIMLEASDDPDGLEESDLESGEDQGASSDDDSE